MPVGPEELANRFGFHKGTGLTAPLHKEIRTNFLDFAEALDEILPDGRAKSIAMTKLDEAAMWSNKAIAEQAPLITE